MRQNPPRRRIVHSENRSRFSESPMCRFKQLECAVCVRLVASHLAIARITYRIEEPETQESEQETADMRIPGNGRTHISEERYTKGNHEIADEPDEDEDPNRLLLEGIEDR